MEIKDLIEYVQGDNVDKPAIINALSETLGAEIIPKAQYNNIQTDLRAKGKKDALQETYGIIDKELND